MEVFLDHPMEKEVRITTDRGSEVCIILQRESKMSIDNIFIDSFRHLRKEETRETIEIIFFSCFFENFPDIVRSDFPSYSYILSNTDESWLSTFCRYGDDLLYLAGLLCTGGFVDSREEWDLLSCTPFGDLFVREYHELFYHHMCIISSTFSDILHISFFIEIEVALCRFEEDLAFFFSSFFEDFIEREEMF